MNRNHERVSLWSNAVERGVVLSVGPDGFTFFQRKALRPSQRQPYSITLEIDFLFCLRGRFQRDDGQRRAWPRALRNAQWTIPEIGLHN